MNERTSEEIMSEPHEMEREWRQSINRRLELLESIKSDVATYRLEVLRLITDEQGRRRDSLDVITRDVAQARASVATLRWVGVVFAGIVTIVLAIWDHIRKP